jgi:hypothetical protein
MGPAFDHDDRHVDPVMSLTRGNRHAGRTGVCPAVPPASREPRVSRFKRWRDVAGQTTTEWLMIAGGLTAIGIFLNGILPRTIRQFCRALVWSIRVIAP